jgi:hypothetical protein
MIWGRTTVSRLTQSFPGKVAEKSEKIRPPMVQNEIFRQKNNSLKLFIFSSLPLKNLRTHTLNYMVSSVNWTNFRPFGNSG